MLQKKLRSDKKHKIKKFRYGATNIFVVLFFFFLQIISQKTFIAEYSKMLIRVGKISKNLSFLKWKVCLKSILNVPFNMNNKL